VLAVINIFGNFKGNIAFGRPDLWVGEQVEVPSVVRNGSELTYKFTVLNNGDSPATQVKLQDSYDTAHIEVLEASVPYTTAPDGKLVWDLGSIPAGAGTEVSYKARIVNAGEGTDIMNTVSLIQRETDNNAKDNSDTATVRTEVGARSSGRGGQRVSLSEISQNENGSVVFSVVRNTVGTSTAPGMVVDQEVVIRNAGTDDANKVTFRDVLRNPDGVIIQTEEWELGTVLKNEEIKIGYSIVFSEMAKPGMYILSTELVGGEGQKLDFPKNGLIYIQPVLATETVEETEGLVLGAMSEITLDADENMEAPTSQSILDFISPQNVEAAGNSLAAATLSGDPYENVVRMSAFVLGFASLVAIASVRRYI
jgi:hypothetical protein